jgi:ADP-dependent NAD(P)H-hydrate dehydratase
MTRKPPREKVLNAGLLRGWPLPALNGAQGKEDRGRVLVVGGSLQIPGGVLLAAEGALRAGAGKLQIATARSVAPLLAIRVPEARVIGLAESKGGELTRGACRLIRAEADRCDALVVGPGMVAAEAAEELLNHCVLGTCAGSLVIDGAALDAFRERRRLPGKHTGGVIITPHAGEMARLWGVTREEVVERAATLAREAARALDVVVVLKGRATYIAAPDGRSLRNTAGNLGLGTSGSGDVLAGIIGGLCARGADPFQAAAWGVFGHARAGERLARRIAPLGFLARELLEEVPSVLHALR